MNIRWQRDACFGSLHSSQSRDHSAAQIRGPASIRKASLSAGYRARMHSKQHGGGLLSRKPLARVERHFCDNIRMLRSCLKYTA